ncbi:MAG: hypothetical protein NC180_09735 [Muribaculaceae bacterium]|nr:hypothetical protein [Roseburia sp.]MCM1431809.1 hypothetical protein [Muribaculaceae bacterium]MCM1493490.1 hypothetical protein [Muribaculaceae bacterium]
MKKLSKRLLSAFLALAMLAAVLPVVDAQADTKKENLTLYVGEAIYFTNYSKVTSVKSSKSDVVKVAKDKKNNTHANLTAKKAGKSKVTIKTKSGTSVYTVTVKKLDFDVTLTKISEGNILMSVKNNTKQIFDYVEVKYTLKGADGEVLAEDTKLLDDSMPGKMSYANITYSSYSYTVDIEQCSAKAKEVTRSFTATYKNAESKVKVTDSVDMEKNPGYATVTVKAKNTSSKSVKGKVSIVLYDAQGNKIGTRPVSFYIKGSATDTETVKIDVSYVYTDYDHYEIEKCLYFKTY